MRELLLIIFISTQFFVYSNTVATGKITGKVVDKTTKEEIPYVSISIKNNGKIITGKLTDTKGVFEISKIPIGKYSIEVSFMGYITQKKEFTISNKERNIDFGTFFLEEDISQLEAVEIRAETSSIINKIDKKIIVVGKDLLSAGSTASEILDNLPAVDVDADGSVSYKGNKGVMIYLDGKPTSISAENLLNQLPANSIEKIELITNPSAKYSPEGLGGIINIILNKKENIGFNGNLASGINFRKEPSTNSSLNLNFKKGKINVFGNFAYTTRIINKKGYFDNSFNNTFDSYNVRNDKKSTLIKVGMDYYINKKNTLSIYTHQNFSPTDAIKDSKITTEINTINLDVDNYFDSNTHIYNLNYKVEFNKPEHNLEFEVNYDNSNIDQKNVNIDDSTTSNLTNYIDNIDIKREFTVINLDYQNSFENDIDLELGIESLIRRADNKKETNQLNLDPSFLFEYDRNGYSFYTTFAKKINEKFSYKLGSRIEYFEIKSYLDGNSVHKDDYTTLYPSLHLTYNQSEKNIFKLGYSKHIFRPEINDVNPTNLWNSYTMTFIGNPKLKPTFVDYFAVEYLRVLKKGSFSFELSYQLSKNNVYQSLYQDPNNADKLIISYDNADKYKNIGAFLSFYYRLTNWWMLSFNGVYVYNDQIGELNNQKASADYNYTSATLSQSFKVTNKLRLSLLAKHYGLVKSIQTRTEARQKVDLGARYTFLKNKASASIKVTDIFDSMDQRFNVYDPYTQNGKSTLDSQSIYFGFTYNFGSSKIKKRNRKAHEKQEVNDGGVF